MDDAIDQRLSALERELDAVVTELDDFTKQRARLDSLVTLAPFFHTSFLAKKRDMKRIEQDRNNEEQILRDLDIRIANDPNTGDRDPIERAFGIDLAQERERRQSKLEWLNRELVQAKEAVRGSQLQRDEMAPEKIPAVKFELTRIASELKRLEQRKEALQVQVRTLRRSVLDDSRSRSAVMGAGPIRHRHVRFPTDHSLGLLYVRSRECSLEMPWQLVGNASGIVEIAEDMDSLLIMTGSPHDLALLRDEDLQILYVADEMAGFRVAPFTKHMPSLTIVPAPNHEWMDQWLTPQQRKPVNFQP